MPKESVEDAQTEIAYSQRATRKRGKRKSMISENHAVQNTIEILSHHLPYAARSDKATEIRALYGARDTKATEEKSSMKPKRCTATENKKGLKAVYKRIEVEETGKYEARSEEAAEMISQQQCILSGEVYLRHRLEKRAFPKNLPALLSPYIYYASSGQGVIKNRRAVFRRAGMQEIAATKIIVTQMSS